MRQKSKQILGQGPKKKGLLLAIFSSLSFFIIWLLISLSGLIKPLYLPTPWRVISAAFEIKPNILVHSFYTTNLIIIGLIIGSILGYLAGFGVRQNFYLNKILTPIIQSWRPVPVVALIPFFILWFGFAWIGKIVLISLGVFLIVVVGVVNSIDQISPIYLRIILSFGGDNWKFLKYAAFHGIMPSMLAPLRIALAIATTLAVVSEYMGATQGLGYVINIALNSFSSHTILLCAIVLGLIGGVLDFLLQLIHTKLTKWAKSSKEAIKY